MQATAGITKPSTHKVFAPTAAGLMLPIIIGVVPAISGVRTSATAVKASPLTAGVTAIVTAEPMVPTSVAAKMHTCTVASSTVGARYTPYISEVNLVSQKLATSRS